MKITKAEREYLEGLKENTAFAYMTVHEFAVYLLGLGKGEHVLKEGLYLDNKALKYGADAAQRIGATAFHNATNPAVADMLAAADSAPRDPGSSGLDNDAVHPPSRRRNKNAG